ncbi:MAG: hypothetical protein RQ885_00515 [Desulfurococcales archaeon]|nr:hypothetical protein [Desulfurococcales archaeon]
MPLGSTALPRSLPWNITREVKWREAREMIYYRIERGTSGQEKADY